MINAKNPLGAAVIAASVLLGTASSHAVESHPATTIISGTASWYGAELHGRLTASGERFDMEALTAAHPTLPFGTKLRVTNMANGKSVIVRINDRGPAHGKRVIDLSRKAAEAIGIVKKGLGRVKIEVIKSV